MSDWPKYESHKVVQAAKIVDFYDDAGGRTSALVDNPANPGFHEHFSPNAQGMLALAELGDWAILYADGFKSISPAKAFEEGYTLMPAQAVTTITSEQLWAEIGPLRNALKNCVDFWPSALNDDLQERTWHEAQAILGNPEP